jgi:prepilin-type N-terminal cleavage/methylation domain-containing protein
MIIRCTDHRGFSLTELIVTTALISVATGMGAPLLSGAAGRSRSYSAMHDIAGQIRTARLAAVSTNRAMRIMFNCPGPGQYRVIEITGLAAIDNDANRCVYPWPDPDPGNLPDNDGPVMLLPQGIDFVATQDLQIDAFGQITPLAGGMPAQIGVTDGTFARQITVSTAGRIQLP